MRIVLRSLLALALTTGLAAAAQPLPRETEVRPVELRTDAVGQEPVIRIRPGVSTVLTFDVKSAREPALQVELERAAAFTRVERGESVLRLVPSDALKPEERLRLLVRFEDGVLPAMATFILLVSDEQVDRLVDVSRAPLPDEPSRPEVREAWAAVRQCQEALARAQARPSGMTALRLADVLAHGGVVVSNSSGLAARSRQGAFVVKQLRTFRANNRVLMELSLRAREAGAPWTVRSASLAGAGGELLKVVSLWQEEPVTAEDSSRILVEAEAEVALPQEPWTLWLSDEEGGRALVLGGLTFAPIESREQVSSASGPR